MSDGISNDPEWDDALDPQLEEQLERQIARLRSLTEQARDSISDPADADSAQGSAGLGTEGDSGADAGADDAETPPAVAGDGPDGSTSDGSWGDEPSAEVDSSGPAADLESMHAGDAELRPLGELEAADEDEPVYAPQDDADTGGEDDAPWPDEPGHVPASGPERSRTSGGGWDPEEGAELAPPAHAVATAPPPAKPESVLVEELWVDTQEAIAQLRDTAQDLRAAVASGTLTAQAAANTPTLSEESLRAITKAVGRAETAVERLGRQLPTQVTASVQGELSDLVTEVRNSISRLGTDLDSGLGRVERELKDDVGRHGDTLSESLLRIERDMRQQVDTLEERVRAEVERVSDTVTRELDGPAHAVRDLQSDLLSQTRRIEAAVRDNNASESVKDLGELIERQQALLDQLQGRIDLQRDELERMEASLGNEVRTAVRDELVSTRKAVGKLDELNIGGALSNIAEANIAALERLSDLTETASRDRLQRVQDIEQLLDTMTEGWSGLYRGMERVVQKVESIDERVDTFERTIESMVNLEGALSQAIDTMEAQFATNMGQMSDHLQALQPAPVVVTVDHPNATVENLTRSGFISGKE